AISYSYFSLKLLWGSDTGSFLMNDYLEIVDTPGTFGGFVPGVLIPLIIVWAVVLVILGKGVQKGIEAANKIFIPLLIITFLIIVIRAVTLPGAFSGLQAFFEPDFSKILDAQVWV